MAEPLTDGPPAVPAGAASGPHVQVDPSGLSFPVGPDETVIQAAWRAGLKWPTVCQGNANCGVCMSTVVDGLENCSAIAGDEAETLERVARVNGGPFRLVCRLKVTGPVRLLRRGVRPTA